MDFNRNTGDRGIVVSLSQGVWTHSLVSETIGAQQWEDVVEYSPTREDRGC